MALLDDIKTALRISPTNTAFDSEIEDLIDAAKADLGLSGVDPAKVTPDTDALIKRAVTTYVKAHFGWENNDYERLERAYGMLKGHLSLASDYRMKPEEGSP